MTSTFRVPHRGTITAHKTLEQPATEQVTFLRLPEVKAVTGLSKTSLYGLIRRQNFPAPVRLGPRAVAWVRSEVNQWAASRVLASRSAPASVDGRIMPRSVRPQPRPEARRSA